MVSTLVYHKAVQLALVLAQAEKPVPKSVDATTKFKLFAMLTLLALAGIALVFLSWLYLRAGRRVLQRSDLPTDRRRTPARFAEDWTRTPLHGEDQADPEDAERPPPS